jgi:hypothetical protein
MAKRTVVYFGCVEPTHNRGCVVDEIQGQIENHLRARGIFVDQFDVIKIPGPDRLARHLSESRRDSYRECIAELCGVHNIVAIVVVGHQNCAGHPVEDEDHRKDIRASVEYIANNFFSVPVFGFFAEKVQGDLCPVRPVCDYVILNATAAA